MTTPERDIASRSEPPVTRTARTMAWLALALLSVAPVMPTLRATFVYDDTTIIRDNALLRGWGALARVWSQPYWPAEGGPDLFGLYRPLQMAVLALVWNLGSGSSRPFHLLALALAFASALAVWWLLRRGVAWPVALLAACWFATHPLHVEAIASVANTSELLVLLCIVALVRVLDTPQSGEPRGDSVVERVAPDNPATSWPWPRALLAAVLAAAALLSKESGLLAVPVAAVTVWGWRRDPDSSGIREFIALRARAWAAVLVSLVAVIGARSVVLGAVVAPPTIAAQGLESLGISQRVPLMLSLWPRIVGMLAWPTALAPYYGPTILPASRIAFALLGAMIALGVLVLALVVARRGDRRLLVAVAWIALTYFPASNLLSPTGQLLADRTLVGATVGVTLGIAWALDRLRGVPRLICMVIVALLVARDAVITTRYAVAWTSHRTLWTRLLESQPEEHLGYKLLGMDARVRGDTARALVLLDRALTMAPTDRQIRFEYGQSLYAARNYGSAAQVLSPLMHDSDARAEPGLVALYLDAVGRSAGAAAVAREATPLLHGGAASTAALYLGMAQLQLGNRTAADSAFSLGLRRAPGDTVLAARRDALRAGAERR